MRHIIEQKRKSSRDGDDMLSILLQARDGESGLVLSEDELIGHTNVFFVAGHETTANALTWTLLLLSQHSNVAAELLDELDSVLHGTAPTLEQLEQLPFLDRVVTESLRMFPPAIFNGRVTSQPTEFCGYELATGTEVLVSIYHTHRMPDLIDPRAFVRSAGTAFIRRFLSTTPSAPARGCASAGSSPCKR